MMIPPRTESSVSQLTSRIASPHAMKASTNPIQCLVSSDGMRRHNRALFHVNGVIEEIRIIFLLLYKSKRDIFATVVGSCSFQNLSYIMGGEASGMQTYLG
ncbi:hypothetical protein PsorP6_002223 [Peronosclerospora sorghi]|uniref:Uncharacterized protein n=1 Tax=Peronosclerospora sorghi TaxID=230839 RepID=A0ACC0WUL7_9STRA|nr:hypothetical protein PsorP6_002223 [Peronosclerospora sorghi]